MKKNLKNKILETLNKKDISPKPKWQFLLKDYLVWFFGTASVLVGGIASSVIIFVVVNSDWQAYRFLSGSVLEHTIKVAPYYWILFLSIFILIADYNFKHTKGGYRYSVPKVVLLVVSASIVLGFVFYQIGLAHVADYALNRLPGYHRFTDIKQNMWNRPEEGLLAGTLVFSEREDVLILEDFNGNMWEIGVENLMPMHFEIISGSEIIVLSGSFLEDGHFEACAVKPWELKGESFYIRERMIKEMEELGMPIPLGPGPQGMGMGMMRNQIEEEELSTTTDERNLFWMRINKCGRGTTSPTGPNI